MQNDIEAELVHFVVMAAAFQADFDAANPREPLGKSPEQRRVERQLQLFRR